MVETIRYILMWLFIFIIGSLIVNFLIYPSSFESFKSNVKRITGDVFDKIHYWESYNPVVQIKTKRSMRHYTHSERVPTNEIAYWGKGTDFRKEYYGDK